MKKKDWVGKKFDMLTILEELPESKFLVKCDCGVIKEMNRTIAYARYFKTCGCLKHKHRTGEKFGDMTILEDYVDANKYSMRFCIALCHCGRKIKTRTDSIISGDTSSCGCKRSKSLNMRNDAFKTPDEESLYWAGFLAADGCVFHKYVKLSIHGQDMGHLYKMKEWLNTDYPISRVKDRNCFQIQIWSEEMKLDLLPYGITPKKSFTYSPTDICLRSPDFWRGMVDGDGFISTNNPKRTYPVIGLCGSKLACEGFKEFVSLFCESKANVRPSENIFNISYGGKYAIQIMQKLYGNNPKFYLDRKYELANKFCNFPLADDSGIN